MTLHKRPLHAEDLQQQRQVLQQRLLQSNSGEDIPILNFLDAQVCCVPACHAKVMLIQGSAYLRVCIGEVCSSGSTWCQPGRG